MSAPQDIQHALSPARSVYLVARTEFTTRVRSRTFRIGTALIVLLLAGYVALQVRVLNHRTSTTMVGLVGRTRILAGPLQLSATALGLHLRLRSVVGESQGEKQVREGHLDLVISGTPVAPVVLVDNQLDAATQATLTDAVREHELAALLTSHGLHPQAVEAAVGSAAIRVRALKSTPPRHSPQEIVGIIVGAVLSTSLMVYGNLVAQRVVEEKASRIVEILLSTVRPGQLLFGKLVGIGLVGVLQLAIIGAAGLMLIALSHVATLPSLGPSVIAGALLWFVLGFVLYGMLYAAAGSLVSRQEDATMATMPISIGLILTYVVGLSVALPDGGSLAATVLSVLPPFAPVVMPARMAAGDASTWQLVLAVLLVVGSIRGTTWFAGRIYGNSILRTGTRIALGEALWSVPPRHRVRRDEIGLRRDQTGQISRDLS
ncbi:MAG TPA: ABC transporter permease [Chloroflexota bacterium]